MTGLASLAIPVASLQAAQPQTFSNPYAQVNEEFLYWTWIQKLVEKETDLSPQTLLVTLITNIIIRLGLTHQISVLTKSLKCTLPASISNTPGTVDIVSLEELKYEDTLKFQEVPYWLSDTITPPQKKETKQPEQAKEQTPTAATSQQPKQTVPKDISSVFGIHDGFARYIKIEMMVESNPYVFIAKVQTKSPIQ